MSNTPTYYGFFARANSAQNIPSSTWTTVKNVQVEWDKLNCYDPATGRCTPDKKGYYQPHGICVINNLKDQGRLILKVRKNGQDWAILDRNVMGKETNAGGGSMTQVYLNGTTDYVDFQFFHDDAGAETIGPANPEFIGNGSIGLIYLGDDETPPEDPPEEDPPSPDPPEEPPEEPPAPDNTAAAAMVAFTRITTNVHPAQPFAVNENMYTYRGKYFRTYFAWVNDVPLEVQVSYYDHDTDEFGPAFPWGNPMPGATDTHALPSLVVSADGHILVAQEQLTNTHPVNGHESPVHFRRSSAPESLESWYDIPGSPFSDELSYSHLMRLPDGKIVYIARQDTNDIACYISEDNGHTFLNFDGFPIAPNHWENKDIVQLPNDQWAYQHVREVPGGLAMSVQVRDDEQSFPTSYMLFTRDCTTWGNWEWYIHGTGWSDNALSGPISFTDLRGHCLVTGDANQISAPIDNLLRRFRVADNHLAMLHRYRPNDAAPNVYRFTVIGPDGTRYGGHDIFANLSPAGSVDFNSANIIPINPSRGAYQILIKDADGEVVLLETTSYGKHWQLVDSLTNHAMASDAKDRGYDYHDPVHNIWGLTYAFTDASFGVLLIRKPTNSLT